MTTTVALIADATTNAKPFLGIAPGKNAGAPVLWLDFDRRRVGNAFRFKALNINASQIFSCETPIEGQERLRAQHVM